MNVSDLNRETRPPRERCPVTVESPCILVCSIDRSTGHCFGCGRSSAEITNWLVYSAAERRAIMDELPARLDKIERKPRRVTKRQRLALERGEG
jgi:uncharacterized protein